MGKDKKRKAFFLVFLARNWRSIGAMAKAVVKRERPFPWKLGLGFAALVTYVIIPTDLLHDWIPFVGQLDDGLVGLGFLKLMAKEVEKFMNVP